MGSAIFVFLTSFTTVFCFGGSARISVTNSSRLNPLLSTLGGDFPSRAKSCADFNVLSGISAVSIRVFFSVLLISAHFLALLTPPFAINAKKIGAAGSSYKLSNAFCRCASEDVGDMAKTMLFVVVAANSANSNPTFATPNTGSSTTVCSMCAGRSASAVAPTIVFFAARLRFFFSVSSPKIILIRSLVSGSFSKCFETISLRGGPASFNKGDLGFSITSPFTGCPICCKTSSCGDN